MEWSNEVILEFLDVYESEPVIWDPQNADHKDRHQVYDAWKRIQEKISVECSVTELKKKKENLMGTYRKLAAKVKKMNRAGVGGHQVYKPEWFAYEKMELFLHNVYTPRRKTSDEGLANEEDAGIPSPVDQAAEVEDPPRDTEDFKEGSPDTTEREAAMPQAGRPQRSKKRKLEQTGIIEKRMEEAYNLLQKIANRPKAETTRDESSLFCELLCLKLRALDSKTREFAMHEIGKIMFRFKKSTIPQMY